MRILHLSPYYGENPYHGGIPRFVKSLSIAQAACGEEVTIVAAAEINGPIGDKIVQGVRVVLLPSLLHRLARWGNIQITPHLLWRLRELAKGQEVIQVHGPRTFQSAVCSIVARQSKSLIVLQPHGSFPIAGGRDLSKTIFDLAVGRKLYRRADAWIALTSQEKRQIVGGSVAASMIHVIPNGINTTLRWPPMEKRAFAKQFDIPYRDTPWLVYVGRLHETKGISMLFGAFDHVASIVRDAQLLIIGPRDHSTRYPPAAEPRHASPPVHWLGILDEGLKFAALSLADAMITPSFFGFPTTFLEAMSTGVPIVTCRGHGLEEELGEVIVFADRAEDLGEVVAHILLDDATATRIGNLAKKVVRERFDIKEVAKQHIALYSALKSAG